MMPTTNSTMPNDRTKSLCDLSGISSKTTRNSTTITTTNSNKKSKSTPNTPQKTSERSKCLIVASNSNSLRSKKSTKDETFVWSGWQQQQIVHDFFFPVSQSFFLFFFIAKHKRRKTDLLVDDFRNWSWYFNYLELEKMKFMGIKKKFNEELRVRENGNFRDLLRMYRGACK